MKPPSARGLSPTLWAMMAGTVGAFMLGACLRRVEPAGGVAQRSVGDDTGSAMRGDGAERQLARGLTAFSSGCAHCHGPRGEGRGEGPAILGAGALPEYTRDPSTANSFALHDPQQLQIQQGTQSAGMPMRGPFRTARDVYEFLTAHVPWAHIVPFGSDDAWAVVAYLLVAQGSKLPTEGLHPQNAASIRVHRR